MSEDTEERVTPREGGTAPTMNLPSVTECLKPFMDFSKVPLDVLAGLGMLPDDSVQCVGEPGLP